MPTIHVIGSEGFIGRALQREVSEDILHCWSHSQSDPDHQFDLLDPTSWDRLLEHRPSHVVLLGWPGLPNYGELFHVTRNLPASIHLIERLILAGLVKIVVAGTCYEYGMQNGPLREDAFTDPQNYYAIAKDTLRRVLALRCLASEVQWCWLRIFYPYGVGQNQNSFLPSLQRAIDENKPVFAMSSGRQLRDYVAVEDVAKQLLLLTTSKSASGIYNGGSGHPRSILEIAEGLVASTGRSIKLDRGAYPDRSDEPPAFWAHMNKFEALQPHQPSQ